MKGIDLDGEVRRDDPDRWLASRFISDAGDRRDVIALYALDLELARVPMFAASPLAAEIRLTWWAERIDDISRGAAPRGHPVLEALARIIPARRLPPAPFGEIVEAHIAAIGALGGVGEDVAHFARSTQGQLARLVATVLGAGDEARLAEPAGTAWGLFSHLRSHPDAQAALSPILRRTLREARESAASLPVCAFPAALPAALARSSRAGQGLQGRARLAWAAMTGRI